MVTFDLNQFHFEQIFQQATAIMLCLAGVIAALLALDNAVDALAKLFGNKKIDTLCGKLALYLSDLYNKIHPTATPVPAAATSGTSATVTTTTVAQPVMATPINPITTTTTGGETT